MSLGASRGWWIALVFGCSAAPPPAATPRAPTPAASVPVATVPVVPPTEPVASAEATPPPPAESRDEEDARLDRACQANDASACLSRGLLNSDWEPPSVHAPVTERSYERACKLGHDMACCILGDWLEQKVEKAKAEAARNRGHGCRDGMQREARADVTVTALSRAPASVAAKPDELTSLRSLLPRRLGRCFANATRPGKAQLVLQLQLTGETKLVSSSGLGAHEACVKQLVATVKVPPETSPWQATLDLSYSPPK